MLTIVKGIENPSLALVHFESAQFHEPKIQSYTFESMKSVDGPGQQFISLHVSNSYKSLFISTGYHEGRREVNLVVEHLPNKHTNRPTDKDTYILLGVLLKLTTPHLIIIVIQQHEKAVFLKKYLVTWYLKVLIDSLDEGLEDFLRSKNSNHNIKESMRATEFFQVCSQYCGIKDLFHMTGQQLKMTGTNSSKACIFFKFLF